MKDLDHRASEAPEQGTVTPAPSVPRPSSRAMKAAVMMEIHASLSTQTVAKGREIDKHFPTMPWLMS